MLLYKARLFAATLLYYIILFLPLLELQPENLKTPQEQLGAKAIFPYNKVEDNKSRHFINYNDKYHSPRIAHLQRNKRNNITSEWLLTNKPFLELPHKILYLVPTPISYSKYSFCTSFYRAFSQKLIKGGGGERDLLCFSVSSILCNSLTRHSNWDFSSPRTLLHASHWRSFSKSSSFRASKSITCSSSIVHVVFKASIV